MEPAERVAVEIGETVRTEGGIAITYNAFEHDSYEGGRTDAQVQLTFQGIMRDGRLTPSALTWRPSVHDEPRFVYLAISRCVCLLEAAPARVGLEIFRPRHPPRCDEV